MSCSRTSHEVTCSCGGGQRQGQSTTALRGPSSLQLPGGRAGKDPEKEGGRHSGHPGPPDPPTFWPSPLPFLGGGITRGVSNLVEDWHPVAADSRLAGLPPLVPLSSEQAGKAGRYPPSPDTAGLQQPRKSRNLTDHHHPETFLELPIWQCEVRVATCIEGCLKTGQEKTLLWVDWQEKDGTAWRHIGQQVFLMCFPLEIEICSLFESSKCRKALLM